MCVNKRPSVLLQAERVTHHSSPHLLDSRSRRCRYSAGAAGGKRLGCHRGNIQAGTSSFPLWYSVLENSRKPRNTIRGKGLSLFQDTVFNQTKCPQKWFWYDVFQEVLLVKFISDNFVLFWTVSCIFFKYNSLHLFVKFHNKDHHPPLYCLIWDVF